MANNQLSPQQKLLVEKLDNADQEIDQVLRPHSLGRRFQRPVYGQLAQDVINFAKTGRGPQWTIMSGLRGVGKTTLLTQLYLHPKIKSATKFYLSLDQAQLVGAEMADVIAALEAKLGQPLAEAKEPIFIFLDEVHSLPKWSLAAKILYDRCPKMFLVCTSSSALALWTTPDIARRARFVRVGPLSLPEAIFINASMDDDRLMDPCAPNLNELRPNISLGGKIQSALFDSENAAQAHDRLQYIEAKIEGYWSNWRSSRAVENYIMGYETLPYTLAIKHRRGRDGEQHSEAYTNNEIRVRVRQTLEKVYDHDLPAIGQFDQSTRRHFPGLLLWLANSGQQSLTKMAKRLGVNVRTLQNMLEILVNSEVIMAVPPFGSSLGKIAKPYKYLFTAPAVRQALNNLAASQSTEAQTNQLRGYMLEDTIGLYLKQAFNDQPLGGLVEYDSSQAGADFVVLPTHIKTEAIAIEVGWEKRTGKQALATLERVKSSRYGLVITNCKLKLDEANRTVFVPLKMFLLMQPQNLPDTQSLDLRPVDRNDTGRINVDDLPF